MSGSRNFRVTLNLSNFFYDHRCRARLFINDDIQTISDLEERIEKIFKIKNFHLTSQNDFLPPSEDARILQKDDIIWVVKNDENYGDTFTPKDSTKKTKKLDGKSKKRSISITEEHTEEELRSPKKKKKKKSDLENNEKSPLFTKPKKKEKEIVDRTSIEEETDILETKYSPKRKKRKNINYYSSDSKVSTTLEDELNLSRDNVMKINTLLPVLHSHINTYNKKIANHLSKTTSSLTASEVPSSTVTKGSDSDSEKKKRYSYKGNLSQYKRNLPIPTITDKYLEQKKVNIVKIEYLFGKPGTLNQMEKSTSNPENENSENPLHNTLNQSGERQNIIAAENQNKSGGENIIKQSMALSDSINSDLSLTQKTTAEAENSNASINISREAIDGTKTKSTLGFSIGSDQEAINNSISEDFNMLPHKTDSSSYIIHKSISKNATNAVNSNSENTFSLNEENSSRTAEVHNTNVNVTLSPSEININGTKSPLMPPKETRLKPDVLDGFNPNDNVNLCVVNKESKETNISSDVKRYYEPLPNEIINTERIVIKNPNKSFHEKCIYFRGLASTKSESNTNNLSNIPSAVNKKNSALNIPFAKDNRMNVQSTEEATCLPTQTQEESKVASTCTDITYKTTLDESHKISETTDKVLHDPVNGGTVDFELNIMDNSKSSMYNSYRSSITSETELNKDVNSLDSSNVSKIRPEGTSKRFHQRETSGVGQLLDELRSNDSVISMESLDSDHSEFITKRRRKRTRKRRKKNININSDTSLNDSSLIIIEAPLPKPLNVVACPSMHIKFEDTGQEEELKVIDLSKGRQIETENESYVENIAIKSDLEESRFENFYLKEDDILKSPLMITMLPKVGDIIAFKILRITENYTPDISSYVIGKVVEFNTDTKQVIFEILSGLEQCEEPKGVLSIEMDPEVTAITSSRREFAWVDLIQPRLLYP